MSGYIGYRKVPTALNASGVWGINEQVKFKKDRIWPHDPYWDRVALLLPMDNSTAFTDKSSNNSSITVNGNSNISSSQSKWGNGSGYFDGNGDYLQTTFVLSGFNGDCTIECFFKLVGTPTGNDYYNSYYILGAGPLNNNTGTDFAIGNTAIWFNQLNYPTRLLSGSWTPNTDWHHVAVTRSGNNWRMFLDGTQINSASSSDAFASSSDMVIARCEPYGGAATGYLYGYMQDFRITRDVARYTGNFTQPTEPFNY